jgi:fructose-1,6-bisphosphatase/inositol monophosphatase family enzyme
VLALNDLVDVAERAAERAANYIRGARPPDAAAWTEKSLHDFVTEVDREAEELIARVRAGIE